MINENIKTIDTDGITYFDLIPYGTDEWYYGISYEHGDLYEAEDGMRRATERTTDTGTIL